VDAEGRDVSDKSIVSGGLSSVASGTVLSSQEARTTVEHCFRQTLSKRAVGAENQAPANVAPQIGSAIKPLCVSTGVEPEVEPDDHSKRPLVTCGQQKFATVFASSRPASMQDSTVKSRRDSAPRAKPRASQSLPGTPAVPAFLPTSVCRASGSFAVAPGQSCSPSPPSRATESPRDAYLRACAVAASQGGRLPFTSKDSPAGDMRGWLTPRRPTGLCAAVSGQAEPGPKAWSPQHTMDGDAASRASSLPGTPAASSFVPSCSAGSPAVLAGVVRPLPTDGPLSYAPVQFAPHPGVASRLIGAPKGPVSGATPVATPAPTPGVPVVTPVASLAPLRYAAPTAPSEVAVPQGAEAGVMAQGHPVTIAAAAVLSPTHDYASSASTKTLCLDDAHKASDTSALVDASPFAAPSALVEQKVELQSIAPPGSAPRWADVGGCSLEPTAGKEASSQAAAAVTAINMDGSVVGIVDCGTRVPEGEAFGTQPCAFDFARTDSCVTLPPTPVAIAASSMCVAAALLSESASDRGVKSPSSARPLEVESSLVHQSSSSELLPSMAVRNASEYVFSTAFCTNQLLAGHAFSPGGVSLNPPTVALCEESLHELPRRNSETICPPADIAPKLVHPPFGISATVSTPLLPAITAARSKLAFLACATGQEEAPPRSASAAGLVYLGDVLPTVPPAGAAVGSCDAGAPGDFAVASELEPDCELEPDRSFLWSREEATMKRASSKVDVVDAFVRRQVPLDVLGSEPPSPAGFLNCGPPSLGSSRGLLYKAF